MKAVMYHYVRHARADLPFFRYLHADHFERQLDWFASHHTFPGREEFLSATAKGKDLGGVVLTFDDAFSDHFDVVLPALKARGLWGIFYVPTSIFSSGKLLDVHRIHMLLGKLGGVRAIEILEEAVRDEMLAEAHVEAFRRHKIYGDYDDDEATNHFKRTLNFYISYEWRETVLDVMMENHFRDEAALSAEFYFRREHIRALRDAGMLIGSHSVNHYVFSKLPVADQGREINESFDFLAGETGENILTFAYPYGGFHSFTPDTERLLSERGALFSFNVEARDGTPDDIRNRPQALPRHDCNLFPFGGSSKGSQLADIPQ